MLSGKRIILGVTGGIAAYKAAFLLRALQKAGAEVRVTMTPAATRFVGTETFSSLSKHEVAVDVFPEKDSATDSWTQHISWAEWADLFVIAPCTANTLSKIANGAADNMLTSTVLAARCPLFICPTMDGEMFESPAVQKNLETVQEFGYHILEPEEGYLASGLEGKGRLPETNLILEKCNTVLSQYRSNGPLAGKKVVVTAGPTREHIDPVRFISNPSSGKMGFAMAKAAQNMGADVTLIHGPVTIEKPEGITTIEIESAQELFEQVQNHSDANVVIMAAAVSDFTPKETHQQKVKKDKADSSIQLKKTPDILSWLGDHKNDGQILIGFAMETENLLENAKDKLERKNADWIVANSLNDDDSGFASDKNKVHLLSKNDSIQIEGLKSEVARQVLSHIFKNS
ncbi:bifunctional phosphopantothenoylcysteine decarboxylase/phosphopantothenate--cysteine ligase CoaBC [Aliifodinibius salipaludis]|uniref:Coenzyme A biosynthesis bifunctional protein CoaBC n=1 Tax=Fodinibius salipaludis TaxID=2032627 RepID=A0A2A2G9C6_9BACT|nr:bifunctional phosphopantothenoylcysteine decarboxylase/phosphopantothenate--cysteine ligase CoaBC [Aliifodinibius salipaludis]PAU93614.1 bifunctional phosphopantothenoylcysteine decarboxylase/phosphopantothenate--cysteine ligase CoaBC [Aliifodinibius salipaludis]